MTTCHFCCYDIHKRKQCRVINLPPAGQRLTKADQVRISRPWIRLPNDGRITVLESLELANALAEDLEDPRCTPAFDVLARWRRAERLVMHIGTTEASCIIQ